MATKKLRQVRVSKDILLKVGDYVRVKPEGRDYSGDAEEFATIRENRTVGKISELSEDVGGWFQCKVDFPQGEWALYVNAIEPVDFIARLAELDAGKAAPAPGAIAADAPEFGIGDFVGIRQDADMTFSATGRGELTKIQQQRIVGIVIEGNYYGDNRLSVAFKGFDEQRYMLLPADLELWKPEAADAPGYDFRPRLRLASGEVVSAELGDEIIEIKADRLRLQRRNTALEDTLEPVLAIARSFKASDTDPEVGWSSNATGKGALLKVGDLYALLSVVEDAQAEEA